MKRNPTNKQEPPVQAQHIKFSIRQHPKTSSISLDADMLALYTCVMCAQDLSSPSSKKSPHDFVQDAVLDIVRTWTAEHTKGISAYVQLKLIQNLAKDQGFLDLYNATYNRLLKDAGTNVR